MTPSLFAHAAAVLGTAEAAAKAHASLAAAAAWRAGGLDVGAPLPVADRPARPERPVLAPPNAVPRRGIAGKGLIALLHALAHIELNAIDLAWDLIARFGGGRDPAFLDDWVAVASDESRHFLMLSERLAELGATYGELPAHDGLWEAAVKTRHDLLDRLAVVPLVHEARGLDVTPATVARLQRAGDTRTAAMLRGLHEDEVRHVAAGSRWFLALCAERGLEPDSAFAAAIARHYPGGPKPPFDHDARTRAGMPRTWYEPGV